MTMTVTRRKNLIKAIRQGLLLGHRQASHIVDVNWFNLSLMEDRPLHELTVTPVQSQGNHKGDWSGTAYLYVGDEQITWIEVPAGLMKPVLTASIARAYQLPQDLVDFYDAEWEAYLRRPIEISPSPFPLDMAA